MFRDYGYRRLRAKARLKFLIKDWGIAKFREVLETEYLKRPLIDGPAPEPVKHPIDHVGVQRLKNGLNAVGVAPIAGRVSGTILTAVADLMARAGSDRIRFTPYQKLVILDIPDALLDDLIAGLDALGLQSRPSHWRRNLMACSGIEFCKLSFAETRVRAQHLVPELERRLEDINSQLDVPITVNINGCPNSCARIQIADIGFKGQMIETDTAAPSKASRCIWADTSAWMPDSAANCASTRSPVTNSATTSTGWCATSSNTAAKVNASRSGSSGPRRTTCDERRDNQADRTATT